MNLATVERHHAGFVLARSALDFADHRENVEALSPVLLRFSQQPRHPVPPSGDRKVVSRRALRFRFPRLVPDGMMELAPGTNHRVARPPFVRNALAVLVADVNIDGVLFEQLVVRATRLAADDLDFVVRFE